MAVVVVIGVPLVAFLHAAHVPDRRSALSDARALAAHRYVLRQSLGFFQNDFAGRIAQKVMQTGSPCAKAW